MHSPFHNLKSYFVRTNSLQAVRCQDCYNKIFPPPSGLLLMAIKKLISDPDTLALIFEALAGCSTAKNNTTSDAVARRLLPAARGNRDHGQATKKRGRKLAEKVSQISSRGS